MRQKLFAFGLVLATYSAASGSAYAQTLSQSSTSPQQVRTDPFFRTRAKNLARQAAEDFNGGLNNYRAEPAMYGSAIYAPHVENPDGSITFTFKGGPPGYTVPTLETRVTVNPDRTITLNYNRSLQTGAAVARTPKAPPIPAPASTEPSSPIAAASPSVTPSSPVTPSAPPSPSSSANPPSQSIKTPSSPSVPSSPTIINPSPITPSQTRAKAVNPSTPSPVSPTPPIRTVTSVPAQPNAQGVRRLPSLPPNQVRPQSIPSAIAQPKPHSTSIPGSPSTATSARPNVLPNAPGTTAPPNTNAISRSPGTDFLPRALNLARQAAEKQNGGINNYRAEPAMYSTPSQSPHTQNADGSVTFSFKGGRPATTPPYFTPTVESVVTVFQDGRVTVNYNGLIRQ